MVTKSVYAIYQFSDNSMVYCSETMLTAAQLYTVFPKCAVGGTATFFEYFGKSYVRDTKPVELTMTQEEWDLICYEDIRRSILAMLN